MIPTKKGELVDVIARKEHMIHVGYQLREQLILHYCREIDDDRRVLLYNAYSGNNEKGIDVEEEVNGVSL